MYQQGGVGGPIPAGNPIILAPGGQQPRFVRGPGSRLGPKDYIFFLLLLLLVVFVVTKWDSASECVHPIQMWLLVSFLLVMTFRLLQIGSAYFLGGLENDWTTQNLPIACIFIYIWVIHPSMLGWAILGTVWTAQDHDCDPPSVGFYGVLATILFLYLIWATLFKLLVHAVKYEARFLARRDRHTQCYGIYVGRAAASLHILWFNKLREALFAEAVEAMQQNQQVMIVARPMILSLLASPHQVNVRPADAGLSAADIAAIPVRELSPAERSSELCSICLVEFPQLPPSAGQSPTGFTDFGVASSSAAGGGNAPNPTRSVSIHLEGENNDNNAAAAAAAAGGEGDREREVSHVGAQPSKIYSSDPIYVKVLPCHHVFHQECLSHWLGEKSRCPNCRLQLGPNANANPEGQQGGVAAMAAAAPPQQQQIQQPEEERMLAGQQVQQQQLPPMPQPYYQQPPPAVRGFDNGNNYNDNGAIALQSFSYNNINNSNPQQPSSYRPQ